MIRVGADSIHPSGESSSESSTMIYQKAGNPKRMRNGKKILLEKNKNFLLQKGKYYLDSKL